MRYSGVATPRVERAQNQDGPKRLASLGPLPFPLEGNDMSDATWRLEGKQFGGRHPRYVKHGGLQRATAMRALGSVVYAARLADGTIKIGWTEHFDERLHWLKHYVQQDVELLAFRCGATYEDEQAIHATLVPHRARGREYYEPTAEVLAVINDMREEIGLPLLAA
jgi:hypothetical protein